MGLISFDGNDFIRFPRRATGMMEAVIGIVFRWSVGLKLLPRLVLRG